MQVKPLYISQRTQGKTMTMLKTPWCMGVDSETVGGLLVLRVGLGRRPVARRLGERGLMVDGRGRLLHLHELVLHEEVVRRGCARHLVLLVLLVLLGRLLGRLLLRLGLRPM